MQPPRPGKQDSEDHNYGQSHRQAWRNPNLKPKMNDFERKTKRKRKRDNREDRGEVVDLEGLEVDDVVEDELDVFVDAPGAPEAPEAEEDRILKHDKETSPLRTLPNEFTSKDFLLKCRSKTTFKEVFTFKNSIGKGIYPHLVLPSKADMDAEKTDRSDRRRMVLIESVLQWCAKDCDEEKQEYMGKLLAQAVSRNKEALKKTKEKLTLTVPKMSIDQEMSVVGANVPSMNVGEKIAMGVNRVIGQRIFNPRQKTREQWNLYRCRATIQTKTVSVNSEDKAERINAAWVTNIKEMLDNYLKHVENHVDTGGAFGGKLWLRVAMDKGGEFTKISASFANLPLSQSRYCQMYVSAFEGTDSHTNLASCSGDVLEQLSRISTLKFKGEDVQVLKMLIADNKGLSALLGHSGQASRNPCVCCVIPSKPLKEWDTKPDPLRNYGELEPGIRRIPLVTPSEFTVITSLLHSIIAPVQIIHDGFLEDCTYVDICIAQGKEIDNFPSETAKNARNLKSVSSRISKDILETAVKQGKRFIVKLEAKGSKTVDLAQGRTKMSDDECQRSFCYGRVGVTVPGQIGCKWIKCAHCETWCHLVCEGFLTLEEQEIATKGDYACRVCIHQVSSSNPFSALSMFRETVAALQRQLELHEALRLARERNSILVDVERKLDELKIRTQGYHGGSLQGNDAHSFVKNIHLVVEPLTLYTNTDAAIQNSVRQLADKYMAVCYPLRPIFSSLENKFLDDNELDNLRAACDLLPVRFRAAFPLMNCTPKVHNVIRHFYPIAAKWKTLGQFNEQFLESGHVFFSSVANNNCAYKGTTRRISETITQANAQSLLRYKTSL